MNTIRIEMIGEKIQVVLDGQHMDEVLFDPIEFVASPRVGVTNLFIFTCSCGVPGCAGWHEGFIVTFGDVLVEWENLDKDNYEDYIAPRYVFDAKQYWEAQVETLRLLYQIAVEREVTGDPGPSDDPDMERDYLLNFYTRDELVTSLQRATEWIAKRDGYNRDGWPQYDFEEEPDES